MRVSPDLLTIVIPTRDRLDLLEQCLRSVFEFQVSVPVILSDNSTKDHPGIAALRARYDFMYVRQSGELRATDHFNACLKLPSSKWIWMVHDDDELCPGSIAKMASFLIQTEDAGIVVGGVRHIDSHANELGEWIPSADGAPRGEAALLGLGLDFGAFSPTTVIRADAIREAGGFVEIGGHPADQVFCIGLAHASGVAFLREVIGRYRYGPHQETDFSSPTAAEAWLDFTIAMANEVIVRTRCSDNAANHLLDRMTWFTFFTLMPRWLNSHTAFVLSVCRRCLRTSPVRGVWQNHTRAIYPLLFWQPAWFASILYRVRQFLTPIRRNVRHVTRALGKLKPADR